MKTLHTLFLKAVTFPIRLYQMTFSKWTGPHCKYYPTCSSYALTAIRRHGLLYGGVLAAWRLLRCNPWSKGGIDYVPEYKIWDKRKTQIKGEKE